MNAARLLDRPGLLPEVRRMVDEFEKEHHTYFSHLVHFEPQVLESLHTPGPMPKVECHHVVLLRAAGEGTTRFGDLALICANCHCMIHRRAPWPTPAELKATIERRRVSQAQSSATIVRQRGNAGELTAELENQR